MKKILSLFMAILLSVSLVGCGFGSKPESVVTDFCEAIKIMDMETASSCFEVGTASIQNPYEQNADEVFTQQVLDYLKTSAMEMIYTVGEATINEDTATVPVTFNYVDAGPILSATLADYISQGFALALSGADETALQNLLTAIFTEKTESVSAGTATVTINFECVKVDKDWKIKAFSEETQNELTNVLTCNMVKTLESFNNSMQSDEEVYESEEVVEEYVWSDIPLGQTLELATINITITSCKEVTELTTEYLEPDIAQEGTKYVVLTVEIENTTKETMNFNNDICIYDNQDREYQPYTDALWYFDELFTYTELAPNIKVVGNFVYKVPEDAKGYYLTLSKSGTNEAYRLLLE